jgi:hypothetical protein
MDICRERSRLSTSAVHDLERRSTEVVASTASGLDVVSEIGSVTLVGHWDPTVRAVTCQTLATSSSGSTRFGGARTISAGGEQVLLVGADLGAST